MKKQEFAKCLSAAIRGQKSLQRFPALQRRFIGCDKRGFLDISQTDKASGATAAKRIQLTTRIPKNYSAARSRIGNNGCSKLPAVGPMTSGRAAELASCLAEKSNSGSGLSIIKIAETMTGKFDRFPSLC